MFVRRREVEQVVCDRGREGRTSARHIHTPSWTSKQDALCSQTDLGVGGGGGGIVGAIPLNIQHL